LTSRRRGGVRAHRRVGHGTAMAAAAQRAACPAGRAPSPRQDSEARAPARPQDNDATSGGGSRQCAPIRAALIWAAPIFHDAAPDPGEARDFAGGKDDWPSSAPSPVAKRWMRPICACEGDRRCGARAAGTPQYSGGAPNGRLTIASTAAAAKTRLRRYPVRSTRMPASTSWLIAASAWGRDTASFSARRFSVITG